MGRQLHQRVAFRTEMMERGNRRESCWRALRLDDLTPDWQGHRQSQYNKKGPSDGIDGRISAFARSPLNRG